MVLASDSRPRALPGIAGIVARRARSYGIARVVARKARSYIVVGIVARKARSYRYVYRDASV